MLNVFILQCQHLQNRDNNGTQLSLQKGSVREAEPLEVIENKGFCYLIKVGKVSKNSSFLFWFLATTYQFLKIAHTLKVILNLISL